MIIRCGVNLSQEIETDVNILFQNENEKSEVTLQQKKGIVAKAFADDSDVGIIIDIFKIDPYTIFIRILGFNFRLLLLLLLVVRDKRLLFSQGMGLCATHKRPTE